MPEPRMCDMKGCENPAVVHLEKVVNGKRSDHYYCESCAAARGISLKPSPTFDVAEMLAQLGGGAPDVAGETESCSFCGLTRADFKQAGRLGCPECYACFEVKLRQLLGRIHGSSQHTGKVYLPPNPGPQDAERRLYVLRGRLEKAVAAEDFERAATLRDAIRAIEAGAQA